MSIQNLIHQSRLVRAIVLPAYRVRSIAGYFIPELGKATGWFLKSRETTNYTYDLTAANKEYLCATLAVVTGKSMEEFEGYVREIEADAALQQHVTATTRASGLAYKADDVARFHKRVGWYALARAMKPAVIVETGVDKGLGSVVLCAALLRNREEGHPGRYYGTDLNPRAGYLVTGRYAEVGEILYGDSIESLKGLAKNVDLFINDSDHSAVYEADEYETIATKLAPGAIILGDNAHATDALIRFSRKTGRDFLFWKEQPSGHWYPGGGIGISWRQAKP